MRTPGRTAELRKTALLLLFLLAAVFTAGAFLDPPLLSPLLKLTCHRLPERSYSWTPGLCARCTFFWMGILACIPLMHLRKLPGSLALGLWLITPLILDGSLQFIGLYESTNLLRMLSGLLAGAGVCTLFESGVKVY